MQENMADMININFNKTLIMMPHEKLFFKTWIVRNCETDKIAGEGETTGYGEKSSTG